MLDANSDPAFDQNTFQDLGTKNIQTNLKHYYINYLNHTKLLHHLVGEPVELEEKVQVLDVLHSGLLVSVHEVDERIEAWTQR